VNNPYTERTSKRFLAVKKKSEFVLFAFFSSTPVRLLFESASTAVRHSFESCSGAVRLRFDWPSTTCRTAVEELPNDCRTCPDCGMTLSRTLVESSSKEYWLIKLTLVAYAILFSSTFLATAYSGNSVCFLLNSPPSLSGLNSFRR